MIRPGLNIIGRRFKVYASLSSLVSLELSHGRGREIIQGEDGEWIDT